KHRQIEQNVAGDESRTQENTFAKKRSLDFAKIERGEAHRAARQHHAHQYLEQPRVLLLQREQTNRRNEYQQPREKAEQYESQEFFHRAPFLASALKRQKNLG